jgi:hypothetical protein
MKCLTAGLYVHEQISIKNLAKIKIRLISTTWLKLLLALHLWPIKFLESVLYPKILNINFEYKYVVVFHEPSGIKFHRNLILRTASHLDAFSGYLNYA